VERQKAGAGEDSEVEDDEETADVDSGDIDSDDPYKDVPMSGDLNEIAQNQDYISFS
jgi:hypothetical protein